MDIIGIFHGTAMNNFLVNRADMNNTSYIFWWHYVHILKDLISPSLVYTHYHPHALFVLLHYLG